MSGMVIALLAVALLAGYWNYRNKRKVRRREFIDNFAFHPAVINKFREVRPDFTPQQEELVFAALRDYFHLCNRAGRRMVSMPSQVVDDAWHAFILFTRGYQRFCRSAFGRFLHHTPAEAMSSPTRAGEGIKRAWRLACDHDGIDPKSPLRLPLLFAIDADLKIENGFTYVPDCSRGRPATASSGGGGGAYCGSHIGCASGCGGDSGSASGDGGFFSGLGDSDGGGGCGGGCGGD
jgi:hypothetical protein